MDKNRVQTTFRIDQDLLRTLRHALLERGMKMTPVIEKLIRDWLHGYEFKARPESVLPPSAEAVARQRLEQSGSQASPLTGIGSGAAAGAPTSPSVANSLSPSVAASTLAIVAGPSKRVLDGLEKEKSFDWDATTQLNPRYTFETFVIGSGNQFAHAAAQAVSQSPSKAYNPLFIYSGVGMGKTHLIQAIGHEVKRRDPNSVICYISSEKFTNEMINSLRYDKMRAFRDKFRNVDVLLIDDIQFLAQKERTQEEFFHTFNSLHQSMKQIVVASDRPPKELAEIENRLRSRFEWGLIADIQPPDLETKVAILQKMAELEHVKLPADVALYIASNIRSNVRELEGALIRLVAHSSLMGGVEISLPYAQQVLRNFIDSQARKITIEAIQKSVAEQFGLRLIEIKSKNNARAIVYPRQIAMYVAKHLTEASLPEIGRQFGGKHATTVLHSIEKIEETRKVDRDLNRLLNELTEQLAR
jgi:chromosomal replication initiator protein